MNAQASLEDYKASIISIYQDPLRKDADTIGILFDAISKNQADRVNLLLDLGQKILIPKIGIIVNSGRFFNNHRDIFSTVLPLEIALVIIERYHRSSVTFQETFKKLVSQNNDITSFREVSKSKEHTDVASKFFKSVGRVPKGACFKVLLDCGRAGIFEDSTEELIREAIQVIKVIKETPETPETHEAKKHQETQDTSILAVAQELLSCSKDLQAKNTELFELNKHISLERDKLLGTFFENTAEIRCLRSVNECVQTRVDALRETLDQIRLVIHPLVQKDC